MGGLTRTKTSLPTAYSRVGRILRITTRSATLCPVVMVPFLYEPTWRTSSICFEETEAQHYQHVIHSCYKLSRIIQRLHLMILKTCTFLAEQVVFDTQSVTFTIIFIHVIKNVCKTCKQSWYLCLHWYNSPFHSETLHYHRKEGPSLRRLCSFTLNQAAQSCSSVSFHTACQRSGTNTFPRFPTKHNRGRWQITAS